MRGISEGRDIIQIERYRIETELGRGATAAVYKAYDTTANRYVALKLMHRQFSNDTIVRTRFVEEARIIAGLNHPAIIPILHAARAGENLFLVFPLMTSSLADRLRQGPMTIVETIGVLNRIAPALDYAHEHSLVHRDVKPANILFDEAGLAYLSDFGVIKKVGESFTMTGAGPIGTPAYMSPEQIEGKRELDSQSDIYSLGVVLFEMLSGHIPYDGDSSITVAMKHIRDPIPPLRATIKTLSPSWQEVINKAMAKRPEDRYRSGAEMLAEARDIVNRPAAPPRKFKQGAAGRVGRVPAIVAGMVVILLLAAALVFAMNRRPSTTGGSGDASAAIVSTGLPAAEAPAAEAPTAEASPSGIPPTDIPSTAAPPAAAPPTDRPSPSVPSPDSPTADSPTPTPFQPSVTKESGSPVALPIGGIPTRAATSPSPITCPGALPTRLEAGGRARIINYQLNVREGPGTRFAIVRRLDVGRTMDIVAGPECDGGQLWYKIISDKVVPRDGSPPYRAEGWLVEESDDVYYLEPIP